MKQKNSVLRFALCATLIGAAFLFTACWQGTPAGGSDMPDITQKDNDGSSGGGSGGGGSSNLNNGGSSGGSGSGGGNTTVSSIEGITWEETKTGNITLLLRGGNAKVTVTVYGTTTSDKGKYTITGDTIKFTKFQGAGMGFNQEFKYKVEGNTLKLFLITTTIPTYEFKKA